MSHEQSIITFAVAADVLKADQDAVLAQVAEVDGVEAVERLRPDSRLPELLRLAFALVEPDADPRDVSDRIALVDGVEYADVPSDRFL